MLRVTVASDARRKTDARLIGGFEVVEDNGDRARRKTESIQLDGGAAPAGTRGLAVDTVRDRKVRRAPGDSAVDSGHSAGTGWCATV